MQFDPDLSLDPSGKSSAASIKTSQRLKYDAEIQVFIQRHGTLEDVRRQLGFSRRKICQMLLVDPSAWSRWHSAQGSPPAHAYRALEWFLALEGRADLHPKIADLYARGAPAASARFQVDSELGELQQQVRKLRRTVRVFWAAFILVVVAFTITWFGHIR